MDARSGAGGCQKRRAAFGRRRRLVVGCDSIVDAPLTRCARGCTRLQAREVLICMLAHSHKAGAAPLPDGISSEDVVRLTELNARRWCARFSDPVMSQLAMGPFLAEVRALLSATVESSPASSTRRRGAGGVHVVCGHDTTLVPLLCAMGAFEGGWPRYAANLTIELALAAPAPAAGPCGYGTGAEVVETGVVRASEATAARSPRNATPALLPEEGRSRAL
eukprot:6182626-Pleurochrysis_carterae.AAC.1